MDFLHYLSLKDTEQALYTEEAKTRPFGEPYARMDLADSLSGNKLIYPFVAQAKTATSSYFASNTTDTDGLNSQTDEQLQIAVNSILSTTNPVSPQTATDTLVAGVSGIASKYGY